MVQFFLSVVSSKLNYFTEWASTTNYIIHFSDILYGLKRAWNRIYVLDWEATCVLGIQNIVSLFLNDNELYMHVKLLGKQIEDSWNVILNVFYVMCDLTASLSQSHCSI